MRQFFVRNSSLKDEFQAKFRDMIRGFFRKSGMQFSFSKFVLFFLMSFRKWQFFARVKKVKSISLEHKLRFIVTRLRRYEDKSLMD